MISDERVKQIYNSSRGMTRKARKTIEELLEERKALVAIAEAASKCIGQNLNHRCSDHLEPMLKKTLAAWKENKDEAE